VGRGDLPLLSAGGRVSLQSIDRLWKATRVDRDVCSGGQTAEGRREKAECRWRGAAQMAKREEVEHAEELRWGQLELLLKFPEQVEYERIRPPVVFGGSVAERARQTGTPETTLRRRIAGFESEGMRSLFETERVEHRGTLDPEVRRLILDLKTPSTLPCGTTR